MAELARKIGQALRLARRARGMTLRDVSSASGGRFKPTSVAGYERGERAISVVRFIELCDVYRVPAETVIEEITRHEHRREDDLVVNLAVVETLDPQEAALLSGFIRQVRALRRDRPEDSVSLRAADLNILANAVGRRVEELAELLAGRDTATA